jgi:hypothetical protein
MEHEKVLTTIAGADKTSRLEVALGPDAQDGRMLELRRLSWGDGIGWYCQQTLRLDPREAENLLWALRSSRRRWRDQALGQSGNIIAFPLRQTIQESEDVSDSQHALKKRPGRPSPASPAARKRKARQQETWSATSRA